jgi:hypothetical protein
VSRRSRSRRFSSQNPPNHADATVRAATAFAPAREAAVAPEAPASAEEQSAPLSSSAAPAWRQPPEEAHPRYPFSSQGAAISTTVSTASAAPSGQLHPRDRRSVP